ncbi:MAG: flotillin-like protein FloA [bacterium]
MPLFMDVDVTKYASPWVIGVGVVVLLLLLLLFAMIPIRLWLAARFAKAGVGLLTMVAMKLRRVRPENIVNPWISAVKAGLQTEVGLTVERMEAHYLAGGNVNLVINALISANRAGIPLDFDRAAAIDLAGRNVFEAVQMSVNPKVINTPKITAVAKDGIQLTAICRITVKANIEKLVGGAGEETVIARVGEGVVSTIGSAHDHKAVLENPDMISKTVLSKGLDAGTAFRILSIDIADVDVGANIGAKLQTEQAEADKQIAQARAEGRRAMAVAAERENQAKVAEMQALLVQAEAQVPLALAEALKSGRMGFMDYYNLKNVVADTEMRSGIADASSSKDKKDK